MNTYFVFDLLSYFPIEIILYVLSVNVNVINIFSALRFAKYYKIKDQIKFIFKNTSKSFTYMRTLYLIFIFIYMNHLAACIMFLISSYELNHGDTENNMVNLLKKNKKNIKFIVHICWKFRNRKCSFERSNTYTFIHKFLILGLWD